MREYKIDTMQLRDSGLDDRRCSAIQQSLYS